MVEGYGFRSMVNAVIDSDGIEIMTVKAFAEWSGDGASMICRSGSQCNLLCKNTGCKGLEYQCLEGSKCTVSPNGCLSDNSVEIVKGITCPTFTDDAGTALGDADGTELGDAEKKKAKKISGKLQWLPTRRLLDDVVKTSCDTERECEGNTING